MILKIIGSFIIAATGIVLHRKNQEEYALIDVATVYCIALVMVC